MKSQIQKLALIIPLAFLTIISGCNDSSTDSGSQPQLALSIAAAGTSSQTQTSQAFTTGIQSNHITFTEVKMLIREVEFESSLEDDGVPGDSLDFETGPFVVNLNLDGTLNTVAVKDVPEGSYKEIEFDVHKPEDNETPPDPDFKIGDSGDERFSIIVTGLFDGQEFTYRSRENMDQEIELASPLVVDGSEQEINVTLTVDLSTWFVDENGNQLDPTNDNNRNEIDDSIERSFEAFEDNDEDGEEDLD